MGLRQRLAVGAGLSSLLMSYAWFGSPTHATAAEARALLRGARGERLSVLRLEPGAEREVFNLSVGRAATFFVGELRALVHNTSPSGCGRLGEVHPSWWRPDGTFAGEDAVQRASDAMNPQRCVAGNCGACASVGCQLLRGPQDAGYRGRPIPSGPAGALEPYIGFRENVHPAPNGLEDLVDDLIPPGGYGQIGGGGYDGAGNHQAIIARSPDGRRRYLIDFQRGDVRDVSQPGALDRLFPPDNTRGPVPVIYTY